MAMLYTIALMIVIGAIIGGFTNFLAIKMLFRPYKTIYVGKWRVPFTPGLIPKRRDELADQMGKMVVNHLLTPESIQRKFLNENFQKDLAGIVQKEIGNFLKTEKSPAKILETFGIKESQAKTEKWLNEFIEKKYDNLMKEYQNQPLHTIIPQNMIQTIDSKLPFISTFILQKGIDYFSSEEGMQRIQIMADDFIKGRSGVLGNMMQMFMGNINIADKIQPELIKFLKNEGTAHMITTILQKEWNKILEWDVKRIEEQFDKENILAIAKDVIRKIVRFDRFFQTPLSQLTASFQTEVVESIAVKGIAFLGDWLSSRVDEVMKKLQIQEMIRQQVETFSVERLEEMVLSIVKKELKMITFLGALLGGVIGVFQGLIAVLMN